MAHSRERALDGLGNIAFRAAHGEEDVFGVLVNAAQREDLHLEELAELGLDLLLLLAS